MVKLNGPDGSCAWSKRYGAPGVSAVVQAVGTDAAGNLFIGGFAGGNASFGGAPLLSMVVAKYKSDGSHIWSVSHGGGTIQSLGIDPAGNVFVGGGFIGGTTNFGGADLPLVGATDAFLAKYKGTDGSHLVSTTFGSPGYESIGSIAVSPASGEVLVTGIFDNALTFDAGKTTLTRAGDYDWFVASLGPVP